MKRPIRILLAFLRVLRKEATLLLLFVSAYAAIGTKLSKDFYPNVPTWNDLTAKIALQAVLDPNGTAIHTRYKNEPLNEANCRKIVVSAKQGGLLIAHMRASAQKWDDGACSVIAGKHYCSSDVFYEADGRYRPFFTCDTRATPAQKACGQKCCLETPLQQPFFWKDPLKNLP